MIYLTEGNTPLNEAYNDEIVQERNNTYQLTFRFPTSDPKWELLKEETFLTADDLHGEQDFYIFEVEKQQGYIQVYANQVISLLNNYIVSSIDVDRVSGTRVLSAFAGGITRANPFSFFSDIDDRHTLTIKDKNAMEVLAKDKHSILGQWGGDMVRNGYNLRLLKNGGSENESLFMYKKNLSSYQHKTSTKSLKTRITFKTTVKGEGEKAPDVDYVAVIDSPLLGKYSQIYEAVVEVNDQDVKDQASLIEYGKQYFRTSMCDMLEDNLEISVVGQSDVAVRMFDVVSIYHEWYGLDVRKKITKYTYSPMAKRLKSIGFGTFQSSLANAIGGIVNDAVLNESRNLHQIFEERLKKEIANADRAFDAEFSKREKDITDGIELAKAKAEEVKQELSDTINQRFDSFDNGPLKEAKRKAEEALKNAGASSLLAQEAKQIGLDSVARLEAFKSQTTSAQTALSGDLDVLKQTVTSEVNQASEHRRTTTEALSRMTGQMDGFATKSEVKQGIDGLTQTFAKMKVGSRNYAEDYDFSRGLWYYTQGDNSPQDWTIANGEYNVKGTTKTWKQMQIYSKEGSRASGKSSTALLDLEIGETYTLSFQGICYSGSSSVWLSLRANRTASGYAEIMYGNFNLTSSWQTYQVTIPALTKPDNFDLWRIILGYNEIGHVAFRKVELTRSSTRIDAGPAPEDGKTDLVVAKFEFQRTAEGLSAKLAAVESYVSQDGQRQEALQRYTREESAKQATAVRELVAKDYVGKTSYQETVRAIENKFEAITNPQNGSIATQISNYKKSVDGRFADITSLIAGKANQSDFQRVKETSLLYERILGNTENGIADKVARMAMTNQLFQVELAKNVGAGYNYIKNADFRAGNKNWNESVKPGLNFNYNHSSSNRGKPGVHIYGATDAVYYGLQQRIKFEILEGDIFTVSFLISKDGASTYSGLNLGVHYRKNNEIISQKWVSIPNSDIPGFKYKKMSFSFVTQKDIDELNLMLFGEQGKTINLYISEVKLERGSFATDFTLSTEDTDEAIRSVQSQLAGSWAVQNINSAGDIISGINLGATGHNRITGKLTHITGETLIDNAVIKSAMIDKLKTANFEAGSVTTTILDAEAVTADKVRFDNAFIRKMLANEAFIDQLTSKRIFATRIESVISSSTVLEGYKGWIGGFQLGTHDSGSGRWITGRNHFSVGMGNGEGGDNASALWVNWGYDWNEPGYYAWFVKNNGKMYCKNTAEFWRTPIVHGDLKVTGNIIYEGGAWVYSPRYNKLTKEYSQGEDWLYLYVQGGGRDWIHMNKVISDRRYKSNIQDSQVSGLDVIENLKTYSYRKKYDGKVEDISCGIMAQDVQKYAPEAFYENPDGAYSYRTFELVPYLIKAIQELNQKIEKMEKTIA